MVREGMNVARLNFSHGDFFWHKKIIEIVKSISRKEKKPIGIMADLQGPRIRVANEDEVVVQKDEIVLIGPAKKKEARTKKKIVYIDFPEIVNLIKVGNEVLIEDGLIKLRVILKTRSLAECRVINGGIIKPRKGVNIPGISAKMGALTAKDKEMLNFVLPLGVDFVAMSFVRNVQEIERLRRLMRKILGKNMVFRKSLLKLRGAKQ